ncbi:hypothetical protein C474_13106 [Halogeometricum pallidum JCM 14848]|uniref:Uncharacterized protein n=1 Tax=Halogeometricum pallidum JCM 14848 TaxID=1227487 RepID=M0D749_HALPD|nr:hypothetical protein [Halogeometricum pallidum]ELZ29974.1 hypothetical protein C474_13106 [Halogeometricum pallidum JCM 14848]
MLDPAALQSGVRLAASASILLTGPVVAAADAILDGLSGPDALGGGGTPERTSNPATGTADGYEY